MKIRFIYSLTVILFSFSLTGMAMNMANMKKNYPDNSAPKQIWTCSMHPQIKMDKPGKCPICKMDLIPLKNSEVNSGANVSVKLSERARKLAEVQTVNVKREAAFAQILLTGTLDYDETQSAEIVSQFPGRIEKLYANYTGMYVKKGFHLAEIFSPEIYLYQREILIAHKAYVKSENEKNPKLKKEYLKTYYSTMNRMRVLGLVKEQVMQIIKKGTVSDTIDLYSPIDGVVIKKDIVRGQHFKAGDPLFIISNLKNLWLMLDAYELDLPFLKYGQKVEFEVEAVPGKKFTGKVVYIDPILNSDTRSTNVRVVVDNKDRLLKPGMFVRATVFAQLGDKGVIMAESLKNKWISPMHPQIIKDHPGKCDICGMELVSTETLGITRKGDSSKMDLPIVIPDSAPLITGKRAVVYIELSPGAYEARNIVLGPKVGNKYIVYKGLKVGEKIVTRGNFKIDSELQIKSTNAGMMSQFSESNNDTDQELISVEPKNQQMELKAISSFYFDIEKTLADDDVKNAEKSTDLFFKYLKSLDQKQLKNNDSEFGINIQDILKVLKNDKSTDSISQLRENFNKLSILIAPLMGHLADVSREKIYKYECSMAFDNKGAFWFQDVNEIANPYFGKAMRSCGILIK
ncbi:MAG TPA: efflux RND transporter periplasmic adaptor subunit [Victivallales bacterium]|nr:efflux RND transporter periplasmic adaptor subunit [Victivallales bacterium]